ncbi:MAG: hypothetical protein HC867_10280, partial [Bacteroidia bacterium]|nr:hypothetical protein [Bacteroidia bacterium]
KEKTETIAKFYFDKNGLAIRGEGVIEGRQTAYFMYNEKGLINMIKMVGKDEDNIEETEIILFEYEFYD